MMHESTYGYLMPSDKIKEQMQLLRDAAKAYGEALDKLLPEGPDKTFTIRHHRTTAMWAMVAVSRYPDGSPRD